MVSPSAAIGLRVVVALADCPAGAGGLRVLPASHNSSLPAAPAEVLSDDELCVQVRKTPRWPRSWANFSLHSFIPTGMRRPTCIFWANLTPVLSRSSRRS